MCVLVCGQSKTSTYLLANLKEEKKIHFVAHRIIVIYWSLCVLCVHICYITTHRVI